MQNTKLQDLLGIELPLIGGTMMDLSTPEFVAAISEGGALGIMPSAMFQDYDLYRAALQTIKERTTKPFAVNINLFPMMKKLDNVRYVEILVEEGVKVVETSGFAPDEKLIELFNKHGLIWLHKCVGVRYALKAEALGARAVSVVGYENGGATGNLNLTTLVLVPATVDALKIPVIGGGGVVDGRTLLAVLALGASGAIIGTRLMLTDECPMHSNLKEALVSAGHLDTDVIMRSVGFAHRVWMNEPAKKAAEVEKNGGGISELYPHISGEAARKMYETGDINAGSVSCSQAIGLLHDIKPVAVVLKELVAEADALRQSL